MAAALLVLARTATKVTNPAGDMVIYVARCATEDEAIAAVQARLPDGSLVEKVIGIASTSLLQGMNLQPGDAAILS